MRVISPMPCASNRSARDDENALSFTSAVHHTHPSCASFSSSVIRDRTASMSTMGRHAAAGPSGALFENYLLLEDGFGFDVQLDLVADDDAAAFEGHVERDAPVLAADLGAGREAGTRVAEGRGDRAEVLEVERD